MAENQDLADRVEKFPESYTPASPEKFQETITPVLSNETLSRRAYDALGLGSLASPYAEITRRETEAKGKVAQAKQDQIMAEATGKAKAEGQYAAEMHRRYAAAEPTLMSAPPKFNVTKDTQEGLTGLAALMTVGGLIIGSKGAMSGTNAMKAMTGVLKGYQEGNKERIDFETKKFEKEMDNWKTAVQQTRDSLIRYEKLASVDLNKATADAARDAAAKGQGVISAQIQQEGISQARSRMDKMLDQTIAMEERLKSTGLRRSGTDKVLIDGKVMLRDRASGNILGEAAPPASEQKNAAAREIVRKELGVELGSEAPNAEKIASTMAEAGSIAKYVQDNPDVVGRPGQLRQITDRYIQSFRSGDPSVVRDLEASSDPTIQKALLFAKRYAKFLTDYERSVAGGSKGFTVSLQNRYNQLMSQEQFNPQSLVELMRQHAREIASGATGLSEKIKFDDLLRMGVNSRTRAGDPDVEAGAALLKGGTTSPAAGATSESDPLGLR